MKPMSEAPKDGTWIILIRVVKKNWMKHREVRAHWTGRCWQASPVCTSPMQDADLQGWRPE